MSPIGALDHFEAARVDPQFSAAPSNAEALAWKVFMKSFGDVYHEASLAATQRASQRSQESLDEGMKEQLRVPGALDTLDKTTLKFSCELYGLSQSGTEDALRQRLRAFLDGTAPPPPKRRRR